MGSKWRRFGTRALKMALGLLLFPLAAFLIAVIARRLDPNNWTVVDTANLAISILLGVYFLILAQYVNRKGEKRAEAVANASLITSTGVLAMSSARSLTGSESAALRVAADSRAALQYYPLADKAIQETLSKSVISAYNDLAFSAFLHCDVLARSAWERLCEGTASVVAEADRLSSFTTGGHRDDKLASVAAHVVFVERIARALRENAGLDLPLRGGRALSTVWGTTELRHSGRLQRDRSEKEETMYRLERFQMLYKDELTVMHDWNVLRRNAENVHCEVELVEGAETGEWLAPWYVGQRANGSSGPVNVLGGDLDERAQYDQVQMHTSTPWWPNALAHGSLPYGMRTKGIDNLCGVLDRQPTSTIAVLVYELCVDERNGRTRRLVLDGNHRLAAARLKSLSSSSSSERRSFRVLTFLIRESKPVDDLIVTADQQKKPHEWKGFTPDVGLLRGTWSPNQPQL